MDSFNNLVHFLLVSGRFRNLFDMNRSKRGIFRLNRFRVILELQAEVGIVEGNGIKTIEHIFQLPVDPGFTFENVFGPDLRFGTAACVVTKKIHKADTVFCPNRR